jgi:hypothetical protein
MKPGASLLHACLWTLCKAAFAQPVALPLCFNYACHDQALIFYRATEMEKAIAHLHTAQNAHEERLNLAEVLGWFYRWAGQQSPVGADRPGNLADQEVDGRMDCIDHTTNNEQFIALLASRGGLRFHQLGERRRRTQFLYQHYSAVIEERPLLRAPSAKADRDPLNPLGVMLALCDCPALLEEERTFHPPDEHTPPLASFAIDSWFVASGAPALVFPLSEWLKGEGPNVR